MIEHFLINTNKALLDNAKFDNVVSKRFYASKLCS